MIRSAFSSIGLMLIALAAPFALIEMFVGDMMLSAMIYGNLLVIALIFFAITPYVTAD